MTLRGGSSPAGSRPGSSTSRPAPALLDPEPLSLIAASSHRVSRPGYPRDPRLTHLILWRSPPERTRIAPARGWPQRSLIADQWTDRRGRDDVVAAEGARRRRGF